MVPVIGATAPPWAPEPLTPARYLGTGTETWALPSCRRRSSEEERVRRWSPIAGDARRGTHLGEEVHRVVQDDQLRTRLDAVDGAVQEGGSALHLHLASHMVRPFAHLETTKKKFGNDKKQ